MEDKTVKNDKKDALLADAIKRIHEGESVSSLFNMKQKELI